MSHFKEYRRTRWATFALLLLGATTGCASRYFAETRLNPDGSVERAIWQPRQNAADVESQVGDWSRIVPVRDLERDERPLDIRLWAESHQQDKGSSLAAWGMFSSVSDIPAHTLFATPDQKLFGSLDRRYSRRDLIFVAEHSWEEVLQDIVNLRGMQQACDRLVDSLMSDSQILLEDRWGAEYDVSQVVEWIGSSGREWLRESVELLYDTMARRPDDQNSLLAEGFADISANYGLMLRHPDGRLFGSEEEEHPDLARRAWRHFLMQLLGKKLTRHDDQPHDSEKLRQLADEVTAVLVGTPEGEPESPPPIDEKSWQLWHDALSSLITKRYVTQEACQTHYINLSAHVVGVYLFPFTSNHAQLEYSMEMPGTIVETSGRLVSENRVEWKFQASEAFPLGYSMKVRSLEPLIAPQQELFGKTPLTSRADVLEFANLLEQYPVLQRILETCRQQGSLGPLRDYRRQLVNRQQKAPAVVDASLKRLTRLEQLLGMKDVRDEG